VLRERKKRGGGAGADGGRKRVLKRDIDDAGAKRAERNEGRQERGPMKKHSEGGGGLWTGKSSQI